MPKIARELSALEVNRLKTPGFVSIGGVAGLSMQISEAGARSWVLRVKVGSKRRDMGLGAYPGVTLAQAREKAREARASIDRGNDPILDRNRAQSLLHAEQTQAVTFKEAAIRFIEAKSDEWSNTKHAAQWGNTLETYVYPVIGKVHVADVTKGHILAIIEPIWKEKTETASRVRGRIENVMDWAKARGLCSDENPARWKGYLDKILASPKKIKKVVHHPAVPIDNAAAFYAALQKREGISPRALEFTLLTAARSGEVRGAVWGEIDFDKAIWIVPAARMKSKKEHRVPLTESAIGILRTLPRIEGSDFVFLAPRGGMLSDMALTAVMRRMGLKEVPHGLRSTFRDWCGECTNYPRDMAEMALAHTVSDKVEEAYRRGDMFNKRRTMMKSWEEFLKTSKEMTGTVVPISGKKSA